MVDYRFGLISLILALFGTATAFAEPWDFLRTPASALSFVEPAIVWVLLVVSLAVMVIALLAYMKRSSKRVALVTVAFVLFFVKALFIVLDIYVSAGNFFNYSIQAFFDLLIVACLFGALLWK